MNEMEITAAVLPDLQILEQRAQQEPEAFEERVAYIDPLVADANRRAIPREAHHQLFTFFLDAMREQYPDVHSADLAYAIRTAITRRQVQN